MKTKNIDNIAKRIEIEVNLDKPEIKEISEGKILVAHKTCLFGSKDPVGTGTIKVIYTIDDDNKEKILINKSLSLLTLSCMGKKGNSLDLIIEKNNEIPFTVKFDSNAILDCVDRKVTQFKVHYTVMAIMDKDKKPNEKCGEITIKLQKLNCSPEISLKNKTIKYIDKPVKNTLKFQHSNTHVYAPVISVKPTSVYFERNNKKIMDIGEIHYKEAFPDGPNKNYAPPGVKIDDFSTPPSDYVRRIFPKEGYEMCVPIILDLKGINNPTAQSEDYIFVIEYEYWTDENPNMHKHAQQRIPFTISRNDERNELKVELIYGQHIDSIKGDFHVPYPLDVTEDNLGNNWSHNFNIRLRNAASVSQTAYPNAGVVIKNLSIDDLSLINASAFNGKTKVEPSTFVVKETTGKKAQSGNVKFLPNESIDINITINTGYISRFINANGVDSFNAILCQNIQFDYYIDATGKENNHTWSHYNGRVLFELEIPPSAEWMGVDFGTSAVVALYGNSINFQDGRENDCICDLGIIKKNILKATYGNSDYAKVEDESVFINSNIVLNDQGYKTDNFTMEKKNGKFETNYKQAKVLFSPGDQFDYNKLLPSLKSMMGHKRVPSKDPRPEYREKMPLVDEVYQTTYNELFDLYLSKLSRGKTVEKIVMTYPNTFAAMHVEKLKDMAKKCMPTLRDDYIVTISESDAIAYKYLRHRKQLIRGENTDQHVMVYDMGAGTLDITYFTNKLNSKGTREVDIVGKYGICKAGNYLDYVLAEIVVELCEKAGHDNIGGVNLRDYISYSPNRTLEIGTCFELKKYVKNILKPAMAEYEDASSVPSDAMMPEWKGKSLNLESIPLREVFQNDKLKNYIKNISTDVVNGCRANINDMNVDVVVFSGRMTCFKSIRKAVTNALGNNIITVDFAKDKKSNSLKSGVVEGALDYVESFISDNSIFYMLPKRPFYCNYCVVIRLRDGIEIHCMLNNKTNGFMSTKKVNLSNAIAIYLIQTYASDNDAIKKDFEGNRDLTTILVAKDVQNIQGLHDLTVKVEANKSNRFKQGASQVTLVLDTSKVDALPQENLESDAFRKSSWPVVFV